MMDRVLHRQLILAAVLAGLTGLVLITGCSTERGFRPKSYGTSQGDNKGTPDGGGGEVSLTNSDRDSMVMMMERWNNLFDVPAEDQLVPEQLETYLTGSFNPNKVSQHLKSLSVFSKEPTMAALDAAGESSTVSSFEVFAQIQLSDGDIDQTLRAQKTFFFEPSEQSGSLSFSAWDPVTQQKVGAGDGYMEARWVIGNGNQPPVLQDEVTVHLSCARESCEQVFVFVLLFRGEMAAAFHLVSSGGAKYTLKGSSMGSEIRDWVEDTGLDPADFQSAEDFEGDGAGDEVTEGAGETGDEQGEGEQEESEAVEGEAAEGESAAEGAEADSDVTGEEAAASEETVVEDQDQKGEGESELAEAGTGAGEEVLGTSDDEAAGAQTEVEQGLEGSGEEQASPGAEQTGTSEDSAEGQTARGRERVSRKPYDPDVFKKWQESRAAAAESEQGQASQDDDPARSTPLADWLQQQQTEAAGEKAAGSEDGERDLQQADEQDDAATEGRHFGEPIDDEADQEPVDLTRKDGPQPLK